MSKLAEIAARWQAATPGPWIATCRDISGGDNDGDFLGWEIQGVPAAHRGQFARAADARAIAAAPADIIYLRGEIARLRGLLAAWAGNDGFDPRFTAFTSSVCLYCSARLDDPAHAPDCSWAAARAALEDE